LIAVVNQDDTSIRGQGGSFENDFITLQPNNILPL